MIWRGPGAARRRHEAVVLDALPLAPEAAADRGDLPARIARQDDVDRHGRRQHTCRPSVASSADACRASSRVCCWWLAISVGVDQAQQQQASGRSSRLARGRNIGITPTPRGATARVAHGQCGQAAARRRSLADAVAPGLPAAGRDGPGPRRIGRRRPAVRCWPAPGPAAVEHGHAAQQRQPGQGLRQRPARFARRDRASASASASASADSATDDVLEAARRMVLQHARQQFVAVHALPVDAPRCVHTATSARPGPAAPAPPAPAPASAIQAGARGWGSWRCTAAMLSGPRCPLRPWRLRRRIEAAVALDALDELVDRVEPGGRRPASPRRRRAARRSRCRRRDQHGPVGVVEQPAAVGVVGHEDVDAAGPRVHVRAWRADLMLTRRACFSDCCITGSMKVPACTATSNAGLVDVGPALHRAVALRADAVDVALQVGTGELQLGHGVAAAVPTANIAMSQRSPLTSSIRVANEESTYCSFAPSSRANSAERSMSMPPQLLRARIAERDAVVVGPDAHAQQVLATRRAPAPVPRMRCRSATCQQGQQRRAMTRFKSRAPSLTASAPMPGRRLTRSAKLGWLLVDLRSRSAIMRSAPAK